MTPEEYDKKFKKAGPIKVDSSLVTQEIAGAHDGKSLPKITVVNTTPEDQYSSEIQVLSEGGADYAGLEQWQSLMRRFGRLC